MDNFPAIPYRLTTEDKLATSRLYYCSNHLADATGNRHTCPACVRHDINVRHGSLYKLVHLLSAGDLDATVCGIAKRPFVSTSKPSRVTCPDCLIVDYTNKHGNPIDNWEPAPAPKPEPAEPPHVGPQHEHDCEACIFLGSRSYAGQMHDLFWCPPNKFNERGNVIARRGPLGDYVSGMDFIDREPMLAVAAILALKAGHLSMGDILGTRVHRN